MSIGFIDTIQSALFGTTGDMMLVGIIILVFFIVAFIMVGMPVRYAIMFSSPLVMGFVAMKWFDIIISTIFWLLIAGVGIFTLWTAISDR